MTQLTRRRTPPDVIVSSVAGAMRDRFTFLCHDPADLEFGRMFARYDAQPAEVRLWNVAVEQNGYCVVGS